MTEKLGAKNMHIYVHFVVICVFVEVKCVRIILEGHAEGGIVTTTGHFS